MKQSEHGLQIAVARLLELCLDPTQTFWTAIDHAAKLSARYGAERKRRGVKRGLPDFIIMKFQPSAHPAGLGIELKSGKGRLSPAQIEVADAWEKAGYPVYVARSLEDVQEILEACYVPTIRRMFVGAR